MDLFTCRFSPENPKKQTWEFHTRRLLEIHVPHFYSFCFTVSAEGGYPGGLGSGEKKLFPVSSSFAAWNLGAQEDFRCSTFPALFELSLGGELESGLGSFPEYMTFSAKTRTVLGVLGWLVTPTEASNSENN